MSSEQQFDRRQQAQERLTEAQDRWIAAIEKYGLNFENEVVRAARIRLEKTRAEYLTISGRTAYPHD
jgi:hypothetical protein